MIFREIVSFTIKSKLNFGYIFAYDTLIHSTTKSSPKGKTIYMRDIPINLFKGRHPSTFIKFVNLINRLDRDSKGCYAKDAWLARKLEVSIEPLNDTPRKAKH